MFDYVIRRLLLMIPTFFGTTLLVFYILQSVPDGPFEQAVKQIKMQQMQSGEGGSTTGGGDNNSMEISEEGLESLKRQYGLDKPIWKRYLIWLGFAKKDIEYKEVEWGIPFVLEDDGTYKIYQGKLGTDFEWDEEYDLLPSEDQFWNLIDSESSIHDENYLSESSWDFVKAMDNDIVAISLQKRQGIFNGYLGHSEKHNQSVGKLIWERLHISAIFGITGFVLVYTICIPLGILKALRHGAKFDIFSSFAVFLGYSIPNYAFAAILLSIFATSNIFDAPLLPSRGWRPEDWDQLHI